MRHGVQGMKRHPKNGHPEGRHHEGRHPGAGRDPWWEAPSFAAMDPGLRRGDGQVATHSIARRTGRLRCCHVVRQGVQGMKCHPQKGHPENRRPESRHPEGRHPEGRRPEGRHPGAGRDPWWEASSFAAMDPGLRRGDGQVATHSIARRAGRLRFCHVVRHGVQGMKRHPQKGHPENRRPESRHPESRHPGAGRDPWWKPRRSPPWTPAFAGVTGKSQPTRFSAP
jgi:hypothetical protein